MRWVGGTLPEVVGDALGVRVTASAAVTGGDINEAYRLVLADGRQVFVKTDVHGPPGLFDAEAAGLAWLRETATVRVPRVLAVRDGAEVATRFLALDWVPPGRPGPTHDEELGRALAALHRFPCPRFGLEADNLLATLPQDNTPTATWPEFYARRRLEPLVRAAVELRRLPAEAVGRFERLFEHLEVLCGPPEPPSRLHGDLWAGNAIADTDGRPWLVDPAVYGGHREVDLAMMRLFGGFGERVFAAYDEVHPRAAGHDHRVGLYQLYPLLAHTVLFGGRYGTSTLAQLELYA
ncbi:MAG: fructosamine kinase family protein [Acidimicrobiales bacterium]|jgi:fructosamine-3-kinase|nr:fructosamine kinase family protein [Acidimicrobiales bacterium]